MKLVPIGAVIAAIAFTPVAFAQTAPPTPTNKVDCEKARMKWDAKDGKDACVAAAGGTYWIMGGGPGIYTVCATNSVVVGFYNGGADRNWYLCQWINQ